MNLDKDALNQLYRGVASREAFSFDTWRGFHEECREAYARPIDVAIASAARADRLAWVFASGYFEAVRTLVGGVRDLDGLASLCVTERGGNNAKAIEATLDCQNDALTGTKTMVSGGPWADWFVVLASRGEDDEGRKDLALVAVPFDREGVSIDVLDPLSIVPEIPHAVVRFDAVKVGPDDVVADDAWRAVVRPFRVIEDLFVYASLVAWIASLAQASGQWSQVHRCMALVAAARDLATQSPHNDATVSALAGLRLMGQETIEAFDWSLVDGELRTMWQRDRGLLDVASKTRAQRLRLAEQR